MNLWIVLTAATAFATVLILALIIRRIERRRAEMAFNAALYKVQLKELETGIAHGLVDPAQADKARAEIIQRVLAHDGAMTTPAFSPIERYFPAIGASVVVGCAAGLFALIGHVRVSRSA